MKFLVLISENCQNTFMHLRLAERLANFINYSFDVFTSNRGLKIKVNFIFLFKFEKIKNMKEYGFDPKFILTSIITIYSSFTDFPEFINYVVRDQRAFKFENFEKAIDLKDQGKIQIQYNHYNYFVKFYELTKQAYADYKDSIVNFLNKI